jgi:TPR repeat protein
MAKELHDRKLFTQPDSCSYGECPICFLPIPIDRKDSMLYSCCSKIICKGCDHAHHVSNKERSCPFCREPIPDGREENDRRIMKRIEANDPAAMTQMGTIRFEKADYDGAVLYWKKAAELGGLDVHHNLGWMYERGYGVEKDEEKEVYHYEMAAIGGNPDARHNLGCYEERNGRVDRAVKHFIIAAKLGYEESMKVLLRHYKLGNISKDDLEAILRAHQAAINAMKSPQREAAEAFYGKNK